MTLFIFNHLLSGISWVYIFVVHCLSLSVPGNIGLSLLLCSRYTFVIHALLCALLNWDISQFFLITPTTTTSSSSCSLVFSPWAMAALWWPTDTLSGVMAVPGCGCREMNAEEPHYPAPLPRGSIKNATVPLDLVTSSLSGTPAWKKSWHGVHGWWMCSQIVA